MMRTFKSDAKATRLAATFNISDDGLMVLKLK